MAKNELQSNATIAVMGQTGSGKTSFVNLASQSTLQVGSGLRSCTSDIQLADPFELDGCSVTLIDTPGFDDTTRTDTDILKMISTFLATNYQHGHILSGVIYVHRISDVRMGGVSTRNVRMFRKLCGETTLRNVVIVTTMWDRMDPGDGEARERELATDDAFLKPMLDMQAQMVRHHRTLESTQAILRRLIHNRPLAMQIQEELVDQQLDVMQTSAGEDLNKELLEQAAWMAEEQQAREVELQIAIAIREEEARNTIEREREKLREEAEHRQREAEKRAEEARAELQRQEAENQRRMEELQERERQERERLEEERRKAEEEERVRAQELRRQTEAQEEEARVMRHEIERLREQNKKSGPCTIQ
ncbi:P-loop containing nucleoside triphosphate hydrolase protein [Rickenella mellea]|uniref:P-loop containing nucleoside triphosphate hydrolase protein n=1 Tax=Rickenella mellea TaxID=50990 RepID=A0A4Y7Q8H2_9AGAM|nr:P-loop containing nucleoside triphosphate hydrolase protein [Rickenella mellea]